MVGYEPSPLLAASSLHLHALRRKENEKIWQQWKRPGRSKRKKERKGRDLRKERGVGEELLKKAKAGEPVSWDILWNRLMEASYASTALVL